MTRVGSKENMIKQLMTVLGNDIEADRAKEALILLNKIEQYNFTPGKEVYFYLNSDKTSDNELCLIEDNEQVDWESDLIVEIVLSNRKGEGFGVALHYA